MLCFYREGNRSQPSLQTFYLSNAEGKLATELPEGLNLQKLQLLFMWYRCCVFLTISKNWRKSIKNPKPRGNSLKPEKRLEIDYSHLEVIRKVKARTWANLYFWTFRATEAPDLKAGFIYHTQFRPPRVIWEATSLKIYCFYKWSMDRQTNTQSNFCDILKTFSLVLTVIELIWIICFHKNQCLFNLY